MIEIKYFVVCDNCGTSIEYKEESHEQFIIDFLKADWIIKGKKKDDYYYFCSKKCSDEYITKNKIEVYE